MKVKLFKDELYPHFIIADENSLWTEIEIELEEEEYKFICDAYTAFYKARNILRDKYDSESR